MPKLQNDKERCEQQLGDMNSNEELRFEGLVLFCGSLEVLNLWCC